MEYLSSHWIFGLGFLAQALFGLRILVQWSLAEGKKKVVSPTIFWKLSLAGSALFLLYGFLRQDLVIIVGQVISYVIYVRNLQIKGEWQRFPLGAKIIVAVIPTLSIVFVAMMPNLGTFTPSFPQNKNIFFITGITGQLLLNIRFVYQLYHSERTGKSILPGGFWWISLIGSLLIVIYAVDRRDPVLLVAQGMAIIPYIRNIILISRSYSQHT